MERKLSLKSGNWLGVLARRVFFMLLLALAFSSAAAQQTLRFPLWAHLEEPPSGQNGAAFSENPYSFAVENLKNLAPFILEGMLYGWKFSYTPSDNLRAVKEFFEFSPVKTVEADFRLVFDNPYYEENRLYCWVTYTLASEQEKLLKSWQSVVYPKIQGSGSASFFEGAQAIRQAYAAAIQNAVRAHAQSLVKNKPKEITGTVILTGFPRLRVVSGRYIADLTLYLSLQEIIPYAVF